jgi:hypothetical protein
MEGGVLVILGKIMEAHAENIKLLNSFFQKQILNFKAKQQIFLSKRKF